LNQSPIPGELKRLQPVQNQLDQELKLLTLQRNALQQQISTLNYSLKTEKQIVYKSHYENQYRKLTYELNDMTSPEYERELKNQKNNIIDQSQGMSL